MANYGKRYLQRRFAIQYTNSVLSSLSTLLITRCNQSRLKSPVISYLPIKLNFRYIFQGGSSYLTLAIYYYNFILCSEPKHKPTYIREVTDPAISRQHHVSILKRVSG